MTIPSLSYISYELKISPKKQQKIPEVSASIYYRQIHPRIVEKESKRYTATLDRGKIKVETRAPSPALPLEEIKEKAGLLKPLAQEKEITQHKA